MQGVLTPHQEGRRAEFRDFAARQVEPFAAEWDRAQQIPAAAIAAMGRAGHFGANIPEDYGGRGWDAVTFGLLHEAIGRADSAAAGLLTVQAMVSSAIVKWGTPEQRKRWLPPLAEGSVLGSIALTEPQGGSDLAGMATTFRPGTGSGWVLSGEKRWISSARMAGTFLVFGKCGAQPAACLLARETPGIEIEPIENLMGFRAAGLARIRFHEVAVPAEQMLGKPGFALTHVAPVSLGWGRISTACSALGLLRGCCEESAQFAAARRSGERRVGDLGMVQSLIARMAADLAAGSLLCWHACKAEDDRRSESYTGALMAKYFTSRAAVAAAAAAVQIQGAAGCHESAPVSRFYRNAKIMEIIEGTTQIHEAMLGRIAVDEAARAAPRGAPANSR